MASRSESNKKLSLGILQTAQQPCPATTALSGDNRGYSGHSAGAGGGKYFTLSADGWDENGNMLKLPYGGSSTLTYNWDNKLRSSQCSQCGNNTMAVKYDPAGNRIFKNSSIDGQRKYIVDIVGDLPTIIMELDPTDIDELGNMAIKKLYIHANSQILAQHDGDGAAERYFYTHDRLGSVRSLFDTDGDTQAHYLFDPLGFLYFGLCHQIVSNQFWFTGQWLDFETLQYDLRARQYNPYIGRFTTRDLLAGKFENPLTLHRYLYCGNDPINWVDPWGLASIAFYDKYDKGDPENPRVADADDFKQAANDYDYHFGFVDIDDIVFWMWLMGDVLGETLDDVYIFDHGVSEDPETKTNWYARQQIGNEMLYFDDRRWEELASYAEKDGTIHLRGCGVASHAAGKKYIMLLARVGKRKVTAYDENVGIWNFYNIGGIPGREGDRIGGGTLWMAYPTVRPPEKVPWSLFK